MSTRRKERQQDVAIFVLIMKKKGKPLDMSKQYNRALQVLPYKKKRTYFVSRPRSYSVSCLVQSGIHAFAPCGIIICKKERKGSMEKKRNCREAKVKNKGKSVFPVWKFPSQVCCLFLGL